MYEPFQTLGTSVIAISQEDKTLVEYEAFLGRFGDEGPRFELTCDLERSETAAYDRTTAYLIDAHGKVREIFPMIIHARPSWEIILREVERLVASEE